jgi:ubiquinone/menaquinone biosynthesis C-methylase UbiE
MKLTDVEFRAMQSLPRRLGQRYFELPLFRKLGLELNHRDVLEIGCGNGFGAYLLHQLKPKSYVGVDLMEEQIEIARKKYLQFQFIVQDATNLSQFEDASKDAIIIFGVLHHIPEWRKVIDEIGRVLRPAGSLFLEEPRGLDLRLFDFIFRWGHPDSDFGLRPLEEKLQSAGFVFQKQWTPLMTMYHAKSADRA